MLLPSHGVVDFNMINVQDSTAWNSLFKCIKIQRMQVLWREDEQDYLLRVNLFVSKLWFLYNLKNRDKPFATHRLFTHDFHLLFCVSEIQNYDDCFLSKILIDKTIVTISSTMIVLPPLI